MNRPQAKKRAHHFAAKAIETWMHERWRDHPERTELSEADRRRMDDALLDLVLDHERKAGER